MNTYIVRPYWGYDCDSVQGFNNGTYLDGIEVQAKDENEAIDKAMDHYIAENEVDTAFVERDGHFGDGNLYWEGETVDEQGNTVPKDLSLIHI